jgi:hypothetical protein
MSSGKLEFSKNGRSLGQSLRDLLFSVCIVADDRPGVAFTNVHGFVFPVVGIGSYGARIRVNFRPRTESWSGQS